MRYSLIMCYFQTGRTKRQETLFAQVSEFSYSNDGCEIVHSFYHLEQCQRIVKLLVFSWECPKTFVS